MSEPDNSAAPADSTRQPPEKTPQPAAGLPAMTLAAVGVVFGDIGTSPLYAFKTILGLSNDHSQPAILGVLSLVVWTLIITATLKYVVVAMSMSNDGEGGILALMSLIRVKQSSRKFIVAAALFGAALIYGDGAITPAISVLSAVEGLNMAMPSVQRYILPLATLILLLLFAVQPLGTARIGRAFGPIMAVWFLTLAVMGIVGILRHPGVLAALNPVHALHYLLAGGLKGFLVLGGVFLCVTGAEALYADMGQFGARPIRSAWLGLVFPSLILNYAGQAAITLEGAPMTGNIFYHLCPAPLLIPLVILATAATVIASQSIITGAFSMTRQAIHLGWLPRLAVRHTSHEGYGQVYVGAVNWIMMIATLALTLGFRRSEHLAAAYGIAVSLTMLITTLLLFTAIREVWRWGIVAATAMTAFFFMVDTAFFSANLGKIVDGGYIPLLLATVIYGIMRIWRHGAVAASRTLEREILSVDDFKALVAKCHAPRVPGTAVFLSRESHDVPAALLWHLKHNRSLHRTLIVLTIKTVPVPRVESSKHLAMQQLSPDFWRATATYGFMEHPHIPELLAGAARQGYKVDLSDITYYVGHASIIPREDNRGFSRWVEAIYAALERNSSHVGDVLHLPQEQTVEIGRKVEI